MEELNLSQPATEETITAVTSHLDQLQHKAEAIQSIMEEPSDIEGDVLDSLDIQDTLIERMTHLKRYLKKARATTVTHSTTETTARATASHLPKLDLPRYSGDPLGWQTFWDSFKAAVHSSTHLTGIEKFNYLRGQLDGKASRAVSGLTLTDANYEQSVAL